MLWISLLPFKVANIFKSLYWTKACTCVAGRHFLWIIFTTEHESDIHLSSCLLGVTQAEHRDEAQRAGLPLIMSSPHPSLSTTTYTACRPPPHWESTGRVGGDREEPRQPLTSNLQSTHTEGRGRITHSQMWVWLFNEGLVAASDFYLLSS